MKDSLLFVGLDVHAQNIPIALAPGGEREARLYGTITHDRIPLLGAEPPRAAPPSPMRAAGRATLLLA